MIRYLSIPLLAFTCTFQTGDPTAIARARKELEPRPIKSIQGFVTLSEALAALQDQTGNVIVDRRKNARDNPKLKLNLQSVTFWQGLDDITAKARCGYSLYQDDGTLALVDASPRKGSAAYAGICRLAVKQVTVTRNEDNNQGYCNVLLELAWEPRFKPIYLDVGAARAVFAGYEVPPNRSMTKPKPVEIAPLGQIKVDERNAVEFELRLPAPARACLSIESLSVPLKLVGPAKMLTFVFDDLKPLKEGIEKVQDDVKVVFKPLTPRSERWSFDITVYNPVSSYRFESFQERDWLIHNRVSLEKAEGAKTLPIRHRAEEQGPVILTDGTPAPFSFQRAPIRYDFTEVPQKAAGWSLVYRTPGRIVDVPLNFTLRGILLP